MRKSESLSVSVAAGQDGVVDRYPDVYNLLSHVDQLEPEDVFQVTNYHNQVLDDVRLLSRRSVFEIRLL
jgi:hypothetical protein